MPRRVKFAVLLAFVLHGLLILFARYRISYDAYNHMFFADHYQQDWWSLWEPRWYTGFEIVSYPPLVHQVVALFGHIIGVDAAFGFVLWITLTAYPIAVYYFSQIFVGRGASSYAAIGSALLPSLYLTGHIFGQLPALAATLIALFGAAVLADFLQSGKFLTGALAVSLFTTVMAAHHATLLFLPWLIGAVAVKYLLDHKINRITIGLRLGIIVLFSSITSVLVILPFWQWGAEQSIQTTIEHISRHNFFDNPYAAVIFFIPMYGLLIPLIPFALWISRKRRFWGLGAAFLFLFLLGLGGTTPLPRLFFGSGWSWLTYDRFALWASLLLQVFFGAAVIRYRKRTRQPGVRRLYFSAMILIIILIGTASTWLPSQPAQLDMQPVVDFLDEKGNSDWRYLTFGFGDQLALLSRLTDSTTIDGSYHTARMLPELRSSGIGQIDTAFWLPGGLSALDPILQKSGEHGVRWGFVNLNLYIPVLLRNDWRPVTKLANGVQVWENPNAIPPPPVEAPPEAPFKAFLWGTLPLFSLFITGSLAVARYRADDRERILGGIQALGVTLLPISLCLWTYRRLFAITHDRVYFTYSDALFFLSDGIAVVLISVWLVQKNPKEWFSALSIPRLREWGEGTWLAILALIAALSTAWSIEWRTSLYLSLHLWLAFGLYLSLREKPSLWRMFAVGALAALALQALIGIWQVAAQTTDISILQSLGWTGRIDPSIRGASVVQLPNGTRWLRAYGTLPHPNLVGGWVMIFLTALLALIFRSSRWRMPALIVFNAGLVLLVLTFSRSAWLGLAVFAAWIFFQRKLLDRKSLMILLITGMICVTLVFIPLNQMFVTRLTDSQVETEKVSNYTRLWLVQRTTEMIEQRPVLGSGIGSYSFALSQHVAEFYDIEPVHNIPLLAWAELGIVGLAALIGLFAAIAVRALKARRPLTIVFSAALAGIVVIGLFDHYFWTLAPGRLLFVSVLGLWAGQVGDERHR